MKKTLLLYSLLLVFVKLNAQRVFDLSIDIPRGFSPNEVVIPESPLSLQVLFIGGVDMVETVPTYGNPSTSVPAKESHDFIGFTPDETDESLGWVSVNHEMIFADDHIGDGGGMTSFRVKRNQDGTLEILDQTLNDGRTGKFFNVDFVNTVGETGMNCGGINSPDGRIWTAEEWLRTSNPSIYGGGLSIRDTNDFVINSDIQEWNNVTLKKYQNFNWMVEVDPKQAKAIRKQYNWGRQAFEGGAINDNAQFVWLGVDATPCFFGMFVAQVPGDFTRGTLFVYKHDKPGYNWVPIWEDGAMLNHRDYAIAKGATMFNRIEWVTMDPITTDIYFSETGRDNPGFLWSNENEAGAQHHPYHLQRAKDLGLESPNDFNYTDYYGRIWKYDVRADKVEVYLEGGPYYDVSPTEGAYPENHLSNPDGLNTILIGGKSFLVIQEDLIGTSHGRMPAGISNRMCEMYLLDLSIQEPSLNDLIRIGIVPRGAEITGARQTPDGKSLLVNAQHPSSLNPFPYNHSLTFAIHGLDKLSANDLRSEIKFRKQNELEDAQEFYLYPNPATRIVHFKNIRDVALYNAQGQRILVKRKTKSLNISSLDPGIYYVQNEKGENIKLVIQ